MYLLPKEEKDQEAKGNEAPQNNAVSPLLVPDPGHQGVDARHVAGGADNPPVDVGQRLPLQAKVLVDGIGLGEDRVGHAVRVVDAAALLQHVLGLGVFGMLRAVGVDVGAHVGEQVGAVPGRGDLGAQPRQLGAVLRQDFAMAGQVCGFQGRGLRFRVQQAGELGQEG